MPKKGQTATSARAGDTLASLRTAFDILVKLQSGELGEVTVDRLAEEQQISTKQVRRYLDVLEEFGVDFDSDARGRRANPLRLLSVKRNAAPFNALFLTRDEMVLLYAQLAGLHHAGDPETRNRLWHKVSHNLGVGTVNTQVLQKSLGGFDKAYKSYDDKRGIIASLLSALHGNHPCEATYLKPNSRKPDLYPMEPYELIEFHGGLYVYCRVTTHGEVRMLAVERIDSLKVVRTKTFRREPAVLEAIRAKKARAFRIIDDGQMLHVRLLFTPLVAYYVAERVWHPSQKLTRRRDGSLEMEFTASARIEIDRWVNSWGKEVQVLGMEEAGEQKT